MKKLDESRNVTQSDLGSRAGAGGPGYNKTPAGQARERQRKLLSLKQQMQFTKQQGGVAGPKGKLPEEIEMEADQINEVDRLDPKHMSMSGPGTTTKERIKKRLGQDYRGDARVRAGQPRSLDYGKKSNLPEEVELDEAAVTHIVAKKDLQKHKDWMDSEGFDTNTKPLPKSHPKHSTHVGIVSKNSQESSYHVDGHASPIKEDVELVNELSKKTLGSYVKAAAKDAEESGRDQEYHGHKNDYARGEKRQKGIGRAVNRLTKEDDMEEEVQKIDEVSWQTAQAASNKSASKVMASKTPEERQKNVAQMQRLHKSAMSRINAATSTKKGPSGFQRSTAGRLGEAAKIDEELKGEMHPDAGKVLKHIKPEHHGVYKPFLKKGVYKGNYRDRADVLSAAQRAGHMAEEVQPVQENYRNWTVHTSTGKHSAYGPTDKDEMEKHLHRQYGGFGKEVYGKVHKMEPDDKPTGVTYSSGRRYVNGKQDSNEQVDNSAKRHINEAEQKVHPNALHVSDAGGGKYKVHAVGKNFAHGIKVGEHVTDSHLDDFSEMGGKVKMVKSKNESFFDDIQQGTYQFGNGLTAELEEQQVMKVLSLVETYGPLARSKVAETCMKSPAHFFSFAAMIR